MSCTAERDRYILHCLHNAKNPVSGEQLAEELGISRVALWKRIEVLRSWGYAIQSTRNGYSLTGADGLSASEFAIPGQLYLYSDVASTMTEAHRLAEAGAVSGSLIMALRQTQGRDRSGEHWPSPDGGFYASVILRGRLPLRRADALVVETGCIVRRLLATAGQPCVYRWPNSLWLNGEKIAGWLLECHGSLTVPEYYVLGVGVHSGHWTADSPFRAALGSALAQGLHAMLSKPPTQNRDGQPTQNRATQPTHDQDGQPTHDGASQPDAPEQWQELLRGHPEITLHDRTGNNLVIRPDRFSADGRLLTADNQLMSIQDCPG